MGRGPRQSLGEWPPPPSPGAAPGPPSAGGLAGVCRGVGVSRAQGAPRQMAACAAPIAYWQERARWHGGRRRLQGRLRGHSADEIVSKPGCWHKMPLYVQNTGRNERTVRMS
jgi:hypothetical protein